MSQHVFRLDCIRRVKTGRRDRIAFELPAHYQHLWDTIGNVEAWDVTMRPWKQRRSTGPGSQSAHFHGHCRQIAEATGNEFDAVKEYVKWRAMRQMGYPAVQAMDHEYPLSEAEATTRDAAILIECCHITAAENEIHLIEEGW